MKKYVFVTMNIGGINGAEQYVLNKYNYLKDMGYQVYIFSGKESKILIRAFEPFAKLIHPALRFYPSYLNKKAMEALLKWVNTEIDRREDDSFIVESTCIIAALWGEIFAKELRCRHFAYILSENFKCPDAIKQFLLFKVSRHELAGILYDSVNKMLGDLAPAAREDMRIRAFCSNTVQQCDDPFSPLLDDQASISIGSIGRLEKNYVLPMLEELCQWFQAHSEQRINLVLIGGCANKHRLAQIKEMISAHANVHLVLTDTVYPIPRTLVRKITLFISAAGSSRATYDAGRPTIKVDFTTGKAQGLLGYDYNPTEKTNIREHEYGISAYLDMIISGQAAIRYDEDAEASFARLMKTEFERHLEIANTEYTSEYYDTGHIQYADLKYRLCYYISRVFGVRAAYCVVDHARRKTRE